MLYGGAAIYGVHDEQRFLLQRPVRDLQSNDQLYGERAVKVSAVMPMPMLAVE